MSTYTDASLIVTPNAVKAGKLYGLKGTHLDVVRATTATYVGADGLIKTALANEVRFDYSNGSCPSILVEPQRTNLLLRSEEFIYWNGTRINFISNTITSPNNTLTADEMLLNNTGSNQYSLFQSSTSTSTTNTFSLFVKYKDRQYLQLVWGSGFSTNYANFDLINGVITQGIYSSATITSFQDGWFRLSITSTGGSTSVIPYIWAIDSGTSSRAVICNGIGSYYIWGAQLEAGSNATSYIPTTSASVTRNADVISKSGLSGITTITETFENGTTNVISGSPTSYTMSQGRIKKVIGI